MSYASIKRLVTLSIIRFNQTARNALYLSLSNHTAWMFLVTHHHHFISSFYFRFHRLTCCRHPDGKRRQGRNMCLVIDWGIPYHCLLQNSLPIFFLIISLFMSSTPRIGCHRRRNERLLWRPPEAGACSLQQCHACLFSVYIFTINSMITWPKKLESKL